MHPRLITQSALVAACYCRKGRRLRGGVWCCKHCCRSRRQAHGIVKTIRRHWRRAA